MGERARGAVFACEEVERRGRDGPGAVFARDADLCGSFSIESWEM